MNCGRLFKNFSRWFGEEQKTKETFSYRFTGPESKNFAWNFCYAIEELLKIEAMSNGTIVRIHALAWTALQLRDSVSIYSRVQVTKEQH